MRKLNYGYVYLMKKIIGFAVIALGVFLEVMWLGFCFGSIIIGILLLIFAPRILFFPFNFFLVIGLTLITGVAHTEFTYKSGGYKREDYSRANHSAPQKKSGMDEYYRILESSRTDSFDVIKRNYRRLIKEYHPDAVSSKKLPKDMIEMAKRKTQSLNEAYAAIKEARG